MRFDGISVVVPVYNSENTLVPLVTRLKSTLDSYAETFEIILVNDGSIDNSWDVVGRLVESHEFVKGLNMMRNYGQHNALLAGIREAKYEITVTLDDDLQHPPEEVPKLLQKLTEGHDVVYGTPKAEQHGLWRDLASQITKIAFWTVMTIETVRNVSDFRAFRTRLRDAFSDYHGPTPFIDVLLSWGTKRFAAISVDHAPRQAGRSNYSFGKLVVYAINMATGFSTVPLRMASFLGFGFTLFGLGVLTFVICEQLFVGTPVPGFPFLASLICILSGVQLFTLGIFGEYLARMHLRLMAYPTYVISEKKEHTVDCSS